MNWKLSFPMLGLLCGLAVGTAMAQETAAPATAPVGAPAPAAAPAPATSPAAASRTRTKMTPQMEAGEPRADTSQRPGPAVRPANASLRARGAAAQQPPVANDRVELDTTTVTGNQELPKVMYIVPWKKSDIGDLAGKPMNSLLDEVLGPVDRDVFRREVRYYQAVKSDAAKNTAPVSGPAKQVEK
ncbi:MAG: hypothetical protein ACLP2Q_22290 [Steroidobacteraceae bacterium]|jgi:hypothetical protein